MTRPSDGTGVGLTVLRGIHTPSTSSPRLRRPRLAWDRQILAYRKGARHDRSAV